MGRVADIWADLEFAIDHVIWKLMRTDQAFGACVTSQMISIHPGSKALMALLSLHEVDSRVIKALSSVLGQCSGLSEERNRLIHDKRLLSGLPGTKVIRFEVSAKNNLIFNSIPETINDLNSFCDKVERLIVSFDTVWSKIDAQLCASGGKLRGKLPQLTRISRVGHPIQRSTNRTHPPQPEPSQE
jgi:hypothetical protein